MSTEKVWKINVTQDTYKKLDNLRIVVKDQNDHNRIEIFNELLVRLLRERDQAWK